VKSDLVPVLEAKRSEKVDTRKLLFALTATSLGLWVLLILNRSHPSPSMRWILLSALLPEGYLFYRLMQKARKIKSVLPPEMEAKRIKIGKRHNSLLLPWVITTGALPLGAVWVGAAVIHGYHHAIFWSALTLTALLVGYGIYRIIQHDNSLCRQLGYLCPQCHEPLYEPHATTYLNGLCPKCKKSVLAEDQRSMKVV
jgi:hypothetical protein